VSKAAAPWIAVRRSGSVPMLVKPWGTVRRSDHDLPASNHHRLVAELEPGLARFDDEHLGVGVPVQPRAGTGRCVHEDDRERNVPVLGTDELVGVLGVPKVVELHDRGRLQQESMPVAWPTSIRVAVGVADAGADLASVVLWLGEELAPFADHSL
jgi:hypothetical protein